MFKTYDKETDKIKNVPIVSCAKMKELEKEANDAGLSYYDMMENAGMCATVMAMGNCQALLQKGPAYIFCGKGNNGGDGLVVARLLEEYEAPVTVILTEGEPVTPDAAKNFELLNGLDLDIIDMSSGGALPDLADAAAVIDGIYGTGFHGELNTQAETVIDAINTAHDNGAFVLSLDIPSGLPGDISKGDKLGKCVRADTTVTFHAKKPIHTYDDAQEFLGEVTIGNIGITAILEQNKTGDRGNDIENNDPEDSQDKTGSN